MTTLRIDIEGIVEAENYMKMVPRYMRTAQRNALRITSQQGAAEVRRVLRESGVVPGSIKRRLRFQHW